jgi:hypothetical protein
VHELVKHFLARHVVWLMLPQDLLAWVWLEREIAPQAQSRAVDDALYAEYFHQYLGSKDVVHRLNAINAYDC